MGKHKASKDLNDDELDHFIATKIMGWRRGGFEESCIRESIGGCSLTTFEYGLAFKEDGLNWCDAERDYYLVGCDELPAGGWDTNEIWSPSTNLNHTHIAEEEFLCKSKEEDPICNAYLNKLLKKSDYWVLLSSARSRSEALYETFLERNPK